MNDEIEWNIWKYGIQRMEKSFESLIERWSGWGGQMMIYRRLTKVRQNLRRQIDKYTHKDGYTVRQINRQKDIQVDSGC